MYAKHFKRMKEQINKNYENLREGKEAYEAPKCEIIEMQNEGSFCDIMVLSGSAEHDDFGDGGKVNW